MSRRIGLAGTDWRYEPIVLATSFRDRLAGVRRHDAQTGMLFNTGSVHGFGLHRPLRAVAMDAWGRVITVRLLRPGSVIRVAHAAWLLEIPEPADVPALDDYLRAYALRAEGPAG